ncbi:MAG TPA: GNAT family N-acetyltransferase, partial [Terricaulis sp.]|nr:GNAT family N-acetyltransferase [Terricaulis sp.]
GAAQGFVMAWAAAGDSELLTVAVVPEARRKGVGAALVTSAGVAALVRGAASMHLEVAEDNSGARALYKKLGYAEAGRRAGYYAAQAGRVDAIVMRRTLPRPVV